MSRVTGPDEGDSLEHGKRRRLPPVWVLAALALAALLTTHTQVGGWNDASRLAAAEALVEHGTLRIDDSRLAHNIHDKVYVAGHYYTDKPITPSLMAAAAYWPVYQAGYRFEQHGRNPAYYAVTFATVKALWFLSLLAFYAALAYVGLTDRARLALMLLLGFCSLHLTWAGTFNNHSIAASALIIGLYVFLRVRHGDAKPAWLAAAGLAFGLAAASDMPTAVFGLAFFFYALCLPMLRRGTVGYVLGGLVMVVPGLIINYSISGSIMPLQINPEHFNYPGSPWLESPEALSGVSVKSLGGGLAHGLNLLLGQRGFIPYNPLLLVALPMIGLLIIRRSPLWLELLLISLCGLTMLAYYSFNTNTVGGDCYSIRWLVPLLPLLFIGLYPALRSGASAWLKRLLIPLAALSLVIALVGLYNPWTGWRHSPNAFINNSKQIVDRVKGM